MTNTYTPIERVTRTDFTDQELWDHIQSGDAQTVYQENAVNPFYDEERKKWVAAGHPRDAIPSYSLKDDEGNAIIISEQLSELEEFYYEGGYVHGFGEFEMIDNGNLGDGHDAWALVKHVETGRLFRMGGWYSSWDSGEWNELVEVEPARQTVQRYKPLGTSDDKAFEYPAVTVKD